MKKQIITVISVALVTLMLFVSYALFFKDNGIDEIGDPFYTLTDDVKNSLSEIDSDVTIVLSDYDENDEYWEMLYRFSNAIVEVNDDFSLETEENSSFSGARIVVGDNKKEIAFDNFFKTLYDGTKYAFDGEALIANTIFSLSGKEEKTIELRALKGYDTDGDTVNETENGKFPYMFPQIADRSEIAYLTIKNQDGEYSVYNDEGDFYFASSRAISYDEEKFALLNSNCRIPLAAGKMELPEGKTFGDYGLSDEGGSTGGYTLMTVNDKDGNYFLHTVYIGNLSASGYYYSRYVGAKFKASIQDGVEDKLVHNLSKDTIYLLPASVVQGSILLPETDIMKTTIVNSITNTEQIFQIDNIRIDDYANDISVTAKNVLDFNAASNLSAIDTSALTKVISDKVWAKEYKSYGDAWYNHIDVFGGFSSSDGKRTYISAALLRQSVKGEYNVKFGLLRDEANGAYLPAKVVLMKSYDGINWHEIEGAEISPSQTDKTVKNYEYSFTDDSVIKYIRIDFDVPLLKNTFVVFDEIRINVDGEDSQPANAVGSQWKLTSPEGLIPEGKNYAYLDMTNFNTFVQNIASLEGERVVGCAFSNNGDATTIKTEVLKEFGLDKPEKHFSFEYASVVTDLYVSKMTEDGKYYAYTTFSGTLNGKQACLTTDVIVEISKENASWLAWDATEYLDHSLISIYLVDIKEMIITDDGVEHKFVLSLNGEGSLSKVTYEDKSLDVQSFKYLYEAMLGVYMQDEYVIPEGQEKEEYFRIKIISDSNSPEYVFYRDSSKCYFTIEGEGTYYVLTEDINRVKSKLKTYISGGVVKR